YLDRAERVMERDKNFTCVIFWSVGNECGVGANFRAMADYFHERMPGCIVHSENLTRLENMVEKGRLTKEEAHWERYGRFADINSRMYPSLDDVKEYYIADTAERRPFYLCEYSHAMGNGPGDLKAYWDLIYSDDRFFGGCVWEMIDHSVNIGTKDDPKFVYGGYFGYPMHDNHFCVDGLLFPDRTPYTGMLEYRQVLRPVRIDSFDFATGRFAVRSLRHFTDLSDLDLKWKLERNGKTLAEGCFEKLGIAPQQSREFCIDPSVFRGLTGNCFLTFSYVQNKDYPWADAGYEVGFEQFEAPASAMETTPAPKRDLTLRTEAFDYLITDGHTSWRVDRLRGLIAEIRSGEKELLASPIGLNIWRAPTDNDAKLRPAWDAELMPLADSRCDRCSVEEESAQRIVISASLTVAAPSRRPLLRAELRYIFADGGVEIEQSYHVLSLAEKLGDAYVAKEPVEELCLPRLGLQFSMPEGSEQLSWFGPGPTSAYADMGAAARMGRFETTVTEHFEHYIYPQENLAHSGTRRFAVCGDDGVGLRVMPSGETKSLSFNCSHFTPHMLDEAQYDFELVPLEETVVHVDLLQTSIGSASCGAPVPETERVGPGDYKFSVRIETVTAADEALAF
ncbi:MAG: DUF4981 domain-containing protein, partial [Oscillospiraceae bacterium]|nr:DUF4981 domain-containing protein [Oscillospiraceae bacterium]